MINLLDLVHSFWLTSEGGVWIINPSIMHYIVLAILVAVEGPLMTLLGAAASSAGFMQPGWVFIAAAAGNLSADLIWFSVGYLGKIEWAYQ
jgi:membrane protein DedA with SNARE-associated domain